MNPPQPRTYLFLIDSFETGGIQRQLLEVCTALISRGDRCAVAAFRDKPTAMRGVYATAGVEAISLGKSGKWSPAFFVRLRRLLRFGRFDMVQAMSPLTGIWASLAMPWGRRPIFVSSYLNTHILRGRSKRLGERFVTSRRADAVFVNSLAGARIYRRAISKSAPLWILHNGVAAQPPVDRARLRRELGIEDGEFAIVCVGRLVRVKGFRHAIAAMERLEAKRLHARLVFIGDGPEEEDLRYAARQAGIKYRVDFLGDREPIDLLPAFDAYLLSSDSEGFPNALLEAMAAGLPCVATRVGGVPEAIRHGVNGLLVPPGDPNAMAAALESLMRSPALRERLGAAAENAAASRFTMRRMRELTLKRMDRLFDVARCDVAYVLSQFPRISETFILREIAELRRRGWRLCVASLKPRSESISHAAAARLSPFTIRRRWLSPSVVLDNMRLFAASPVNYLRTLYGYLRLNTEKPKELAKAAAAWPKTAALAWALRMRGVRHVHAHWANIPAACGWAMARLCGASFSFTGHAHDIYRKRLALEKKIREARFVATCTARNVEFLRGLVDAGDRDKIQLVRHFMDTPRFNANQTPSGRTTLLSVGTLKPYKGFDILLDACARAGGGGRDFVLRIVGGGPERPALEDRARQLGLAERVTFLGMLPQEKVFEELARADIFVLASRKTDAGSEDNLPNVLVEAALCGLPIVACRVGAIPEFILHRDTGLLVESEDVDGFARAIESLLDSNELRVGLARNAYRVAIEMFSIEANAAKLDGLLRAALDSGNPSKTGVG